MWFVLTAALASAPAYTAGLAPLGEVRELKDPSALARVPLTCVHDSDEARTDRQLGEQRTLRLVTTLPEASPPGMRVARYPSTASVQIAKAAAEVYRRRNWSTEPVVNLGDGDMQWVFVKGIVRVTLRREQKSDREFLVQVTSEQLVETVCTPYPPEAGWAMWREFRSAAKPWLDTLPGPEDQPAASSLYRAHLRSGHTVDELVEQYRYGRETLGADASVEDVLSAGEQANRTRLTERDLELAWGLPNDLAAVRADACYRVLSEATRALQMPWTRYLYPRALEHDPAFPLSGGTVRKQVEIPLEAGPDGSVVSWTLEAPIVSTRKAHLQATDQWVRCMGDALGMLRFPPAELPRTGTLVLHNDPRGGVMRVP